MWLSVHVQASAAPVMATTNDVIMAVDEGEELTASDVLVKFLMSRNILVDVINDPHFQNLLKSVAQRGEESCAFLENSAVIQKSLWKFEHEIKQYMQMVIVSWKTTGGTAMSYNLKGALQNKRVLGFYSPKGLIFLEEGSSVKENQKALEDLVPDLPCPWDGIVQFVRHDASCHSECQYQSVGLSGAAEMSFFEALETFCIRQQIRVLWRSICEKSKWIQSLIKKSDKVYNHMVSSNLSRVFYNILKQKGIGQVSGGKPASSFSRLCMVMKVEIELKDWISDDSKNGTGIATIINNNEFWKDGNELIKALTPLFKISGLMDTLVPSAGYLELAIDKANGLVKTYSEREPLKYKPIWECFKNWREIFTSSFQDLTLFLNPCYVSRQDVQDNISIGGITPFLYDLARAHEEEEEGVLDAEIDGYCSELSNPFANVSVSECEANHPLTLWSKYGGGFPLLQKCAYKILSQPACCLCKQVEKHVSKIRGTDNYLLRLNGLMMEEFTKMGDQIYQPIHI